jgi:hypothetical protein
MMDDEHGGAVAALQFAQEGQPDFTNWTRFLRFSGGLIATSA